MLDSPRRLRYAPAAVLLAALACLVPGGSARAGTSPEDLEKELSAAIITALKDRQPVAFLADVEGRIRAILDADSSYRTRAKELEVLERYRMAVRVFGSVPEGWSEEDFAFIKWLLGQRDFCSRFCHALDPLDSIPKAVEVLRRLKAVEGVTERQYLDHYEMAIAFALVWDTYQWHWWTKITPPPERMEEIYKYYITQGPTLRINPRTLPHELLRHVIDHPLTEEERDFVLKNYRARGDLGRVFFDIEWTMTKDSMAQNRNREAPYTLMNLLKYKGVCMEQAYLCACVAKCLGVPAVYCRGDGKRGGHAWTGLFEMRGGRAQWNFEVGRYWYDRYWKGSAYDPTMRRRAISDGQVMMTAGLMRVPRERRESADCRRNLATWVWLGTPAAGSPPVKLKKPEKPGETIPPPAELTDARRKLVYDLLMEAVNLNPYCPRNWTMVSYTVGTGTFSLDQIQTFSNRLFAELGGTSPDFACRSVQIFLRAVPDRRVRDQIYETCFNYFRNRPDLGAELKVAQGRMWEAEGQAEKALKAYVEAVASFPQDGHVTTLAVTAITKTLSGMKDDRKAANMLKDVWNTMMRSVPANKRDRHEALRIIGEQLISYLKAADMKADLAAFEPAFRQVFPDAGK